MTQHTNDYNAREHIIQIRTKDGTMKDYYPAAWRLYELRHRFPNITIESEIVHMNEEKNFVVIKATIFDGETYEKATRRASSLKQGLLSALDKVETAAKARAARDFGVSTELALDSEPEEDLDTPPAQPARPSTRKTEARTPAPQQQHESTSEDGLATAQQLASLSKLAERLHVTNYKPPQTFYEAKTLLGEFSRQYNDQQRQMAR